MAQEPQTFFFSAYCLPPGYLCSREHCWCCRGRPLPHPLPLGLHILRQGRCPCQPCWSLKQWVPPEGGSAPAPHSPWAHNPEPCRSWCPETRSPGKAQDTPDDWLRRLKVNHSQTRLSNRLHHVISHVHPSHAPNKNSLVSPLCNAIFHCVPALSWTAVMLWPHVSTFDERPRSAIYTQAENTLPVALTAHAGSRLAVLWWTDVCTIIMKSQSLKAWYNSEVTFIWGEH